MTTHPEPREDDEPMSDYCDCCPTNAEHIRQHYDPMGHTTPDENPEEILAIFRGCDSKCPLDLDDVREYLEELAMAETLK
jgi:hypothetical protein